MLCALTVRKLKPGTYDDFRSAFMPDDEGPPTGWTKFYALRGVNDPDEIITFGFYDGSLEEMRASFNDNDYDERRAEAEQYVESVGADGVFEVAEERSA